MMSVQQVIDIVDRIEFPGHEFYLGALTHNHAGMPTHLYIQLRFNAPDSQGDGLVEREWHGRKWYVSLHSTEGEIIQTCLKAVITAMEHEAREKFTYKGVALFQPHINIEALVEAAQTKMVRA